MIKKWTTYEKEYSGVMQLIKKYNISELVARALINRGIDTIYKAENFFKADINELYDSFLLKDMGAAVDRIKKAIIDDERICIYGDYDVDGITATAIMIKVLKFLGADAHYYIPNRFDEGYGLNLSAIRRLKTEKTELLITVDCGINSIDVAAWAKENDLDLIITDHHECGDILPDAAAVINPHQRSCSYPFKELAGVGVALKLLMALTDNFASNEALMKEIIEIAAIGTVADIVPLVDENRTIVKNALASIADTKNLGLRALLQVCGLKDKAVNSYSIAFILAPRINAAGRLSDASLCVELFLTDNYERAIEIANELDNTNKERQKIENEILNDAIKMADCLMENESNNILVLEKEGWHIGVLGIVASKLVEKYNVPVILLSIDDDLAKGSARSVLGFDLYKTLSQCSELFERFGGHEMAAGVTIKAENIILFKEKIKAIASEINGGRELLPSIIVDYKLSPQDISLEVTKQLKLLEPFGSGNPTPMFVYRGLKIISARTVGAEGKHLSLILDDGVNELKGIAFQFGNILKSLPIGKKIDIICSVENNVWNNHESVQLIIRDIKISKK